MMCFEHHDIILLVICHYVPAIGSRMQHNIFNTLNEHCHIEFHKREQVLSVVKEMKKTLGLSISFFQIFLTLSNKEWHDIVEQFTYWKAGKCVILDNYKQMISDNYCWNPCIIDS